MLISEVEISEVEASTCRGGTGDLSTLEETLPASEDAAASPLDCIQDGVCRMRTTRDLRSVASFDSVVGGGVSSRDADGLERTESTVTMPCAREWRLKGESLTGMAHVPSAASQQTTLCVVVLWRHANTARAA